MVDDHTTNPTEHHGQTAESTSQDSKTAPALTDVITRRPRSAERCDDCNSGSATHVLPSGDELCGYCYGTRRGYIRRIEQFKQEPSNPPLNAEDFQRLDGIRLTDEDSALHCHRCGCLIQDGHLLAFVSKPADAEFYGVNGVWCMPCSNRPHIEFHEGRRELVVRGDYGTCTNPNTGDTVPVLINPVITRLSEVTDTIETRSEQQQELREELREEFEERFDSTGVTQ